MDISNDFKIEHDRLVYEIEPIAKRLMEIFKELPHPSNGGVYNYDGFIVKISIKDFELEEIKSLQATVTKLEVENKGLTEKLERAKEVAEILWQLLDDIDTAEDAFKPETTPHFKYVNKKHQERHKYIHTDGYKLTWSEPFTPNKEGKQ